MGNMGLVHLTHKGQRSKVKYFFREYSNYWTQEIQDTIQATAKSKGAGKTASNGRK